MKMLIVDDVSKSLELLKEVFETMMGYAVLTANIGYAHTSTIQVIVSDLTEKRKIQEELIQTEKLASLGRLSESSAINVNLQFLLRKFSEGTQERKYLEIALEGVRRIEKIVDEFNRKFRKNFTDIDEEALEILKSYTWPGNIHELRNTIERIILIENDAKIKPEHLKHLQTQKVDFNVSDEPDFVLKIPSNGITMDKVLRELTIQTLKITNGKSSASSEDPWNQPFKM